MTLLYPGHRCDPVQVVAYRALWTLRNMCLKYPQLVILGQNIWETHLLSPHNNIWGPNHTAFKPAETV